MEKLIEFNDKLAGAPVGVLVFFFVIAFGYVLKALRSVPNNLIPLAVICAATVLFMFGAPTKNADMATRIWLVRNFLIGFAIGFVAWMAHKLVLKRIEKKLGLFLGPDDSNPRAFVNPNPPATPAQPQDKTE